MVTTLGSALEAMPATDLGERFSFSGSPEELIVVAPPSLRSAAQKPIPPPIPPCHEGGDEDTGEQAAAALSAAGFRAGRAGRHRPGVVRGHAAARTAGAGTTRARRTAGARRTARTAVGRRRWGGIGVPVPPWPQLPDWPAPGGPESGAEPAPGSSPGCRGPPASAATGAGAAEAGGDGGGVPGAAAAARGRVGDHRCVGGLLRGGDPGIVRRGVRGRGRRGVRGRGRRVGVPLPWLHQRVVHGLPLRYDRVLDVRTLLRTVRVGGGVGGGGVGRVRGGQREVAVLAAQSVGAPVDGAPTGAGGVGPGPAAGVTAAPSFSVLTAHSSSGTRHRRDGRVHVRGYPETAFPITHQTGVNRR